MENRHDRNAFIVTAQRRGESVTSLARQVGLTYSNTKYIVDAASKIPDAYLQMPRPAGFPLLSAYVLVQGTGLWPCAATAADFARCRGDLLRNPGVSMKILREVDEWLSGDLADVTLAADSDMPRSAGDGKQ